MGQPKKFWKRFFLVCFVPQINHVQVIVDGFLTMNLCYMRFKSISLKQVSWSGLSRCEKSPLPCPLFLSWPWRQPKPHNNKALQSSHVRKFSFRKAVDHGPKVSSLAERNSLPLETASDWLLQFMTSCPLTSRVRKQQLVWRKKRVKGRVVAPVAEPSCLLKHSWARRACLCQAHKKKSQPSNWFTFQQLHESGVGALLLL